MSQSAKLKYQKIAEQLSNGYLEQQIIRSRDNLAELDCSRLSQIHLDTLNKLVESVTSEVGRALIGLTVLQLCVKAIEPTQSVRLHKGSVGRRDFSWQDGISMRSLDKQYITPVLRKYDLLRLNADGFMMTRSLAENYPYTPVYKANIRGARQEWLRIVEWIETNDIVPESALNYLLSQLWNRANEFKVLAAQTIANLQQFLNSHQPVDREYITTLIERHINESDYAARIMEIAMHSLMQAMQDSQILAEGVLKPLSQMRSANKKHGNVGDIELLSAQQIVESWDAKYGKSYLRDELEELADKLIANPTVAIAGFVTSVEPERREEILARCQEIEDELGISIEILTFRNWVKKQFDRGIGDSLITETELAIAWITAYTESLAQRRREIAPIDEPCHQWLTSLKAILEN